MPHREPTGELAYRALRYAAGELAGTEADAFEVSLATDAAAREALGESVRLSAVVVGVAAPGPPSGAFIAIRDRLFPTPLRRLFPVRSYRGHPALWVGLGILTAGSVGLAWELTTAPVPLYVIAAPVPVAVEPPALPAESVPATTPVAGMEPAPPEPMVVPPMPMGQPRVEVPPVPTETKKG